MTALTGLTIANTYKDLLQVSNSNSGVDATLRDVSDGEGTTSSMKLSTIAASFSGTMAIIGISTFGDTLVSDTDSTDDLGTTGVRWANLWVDAITVTATITMGGILSVDDTTDSTSTTTGSMHTDGGLGVAKTIVCGTGIKLGGTSSINLLDDYEEGTFTANLISNSGSITMDGTSNTLAYRKIGDKVFIQGLLLVSSVTGPTGALTMGPLPFAVANITENSGSTGFGLNVNALTGTVNVLQGRAVELATDVQITEFNGTTAVNDVSNHVQATTFIAFDFSYIT